MRVGLDVGSTTIKCVVLDDRNNLIYHTYERHYSHIVEKSAELLRRVAERCGREAVFAISGSAGMGMAESVKAPFVQEVFATRVAATRLAPGTDVIIELGGEDAKILFLTNGMEVRMNGSCAGGTGLHRPDGHAAENGRGGDGQSRPDSGKDLHHRRPLRRVCQERHPAPHQSGGQVRRHRQEHLSGGGESDHRGSGAGTAYQGPRSVSGRAADLFQVSAAELRRDFGRHRNLSGE